MQVGCTKQGTQSQCSETTQRDLVRTEVEGGSEWGAAAAAKSCQSCLTLCDLIDSSPTGFSVPEILQARILWWVAISFSIAWKCKVKVQSLSHVRLLATPWTAAYQAPPSMGFSKQECLLEWNAIIVTSSLLIKERKVLKLRMAPGPSCIRCILG